MTNPAVLAGLAEAQARRPQPDAPLTEAPGQLVREAQQLVDAANEALRAAVVAERTRATSWERIGEALGGLTKSSVHGRFASAVDEFVDGATAGDTESPQERAAAGLDQAWDQAMSVMYRRQQRGNLLEAADMLTDDERVDSPIDDSTDVSNASTPSGGAHIESPADAARTQEKLARHWRNRGAHSDGWLVFPAPKSGRRRSLPTRGEFQWTCLGQPADGPNPHESALNDLARFWLVEALHSAGCVEEAPSSPADWARQLYTQFTSCEGAASRKQVPADTEPASAANVDRVAALEERLAALEARIGDV